MSEHPRAVDGLCPGDDELVELALGRSDRQTRERLADHLATCARCRRSYDDLAAAVELVLPAVPRIAPPPGFEGRTLARIAEARRVSPAPSEGRGSGVRRRTVLWAAAAAVLGAATGAGATAYLRREEPTSPWSTPLLTADGTTVGTVAPSYGEAGTLLVIDVTAGTAGRTYTCRLRHADGSTRDVGEWSLAADRPNSWVVTVPDGAEVTAVDLVGASGAVWSTAVL